MFKLWWITRQPALLGARSLLQCSFVLGNRGGGFCFKLVCRLLGDVMGYRCFAETHDSFVDYLFSVVSGTLQ